jgi:CubicO group peptidase (beta-lactamase class C family)
VMSTRSHTRMQPARAALRTGSALLLLVLCCPMVGMTAEPLAANDKVDLRDQIHTLKETLRLPGLSIAVVRDGKIVYRQLEGFANLEKRTPVTEEHLFQIASVTKTFTANLLAQYEQERKASLDDLALDYRFINTYFGWPYNVDPNVTVRHFVTHTSEDGPGRSFVYSGQRFNFIYGVFEAVGGYAPMTEGYSRELEKRIFKPLAMNATIAGFPKDRNSATFAKIATPYIYDRAQGRFVEDTGNYRWTQAFPATGILSTIGDLAKYTASYDKEQLISAASYKRLTTPQILGDGSTSPYGIGWFTESFAGKQLHWHYGHADSYAALFIRVPEAGYTFIVLSNSNAPSEALRLGAGHIAQSPFAALLLKRFVFNRFTDKQARDALDVELKLGRALFSHYAARTFGTDDEAPRIISEMFGNNPTRFDRYDAALTYLLSDLQMPSLREPMERLTGGFERYGHVQPYVARDLARYFEGSGESDRALRFYRQIADAKGFEAHEAFVNACLKVGELLARRGEMVTARTYYWKAVNSMKLLGADDSAIQSQIAQMNIVSKAGDGKK